MAVWVRNKDGSMSESRSTDYYGMVWDYLLVQFGLDPNLTSSFFLAVAFVSLGDFDNRSLAKRH